jgi:hypothetical protein
MSDPVVGFSRQRCTSPVGPKDLSATATLTLRIRLPSPWRRDARGGDSSCQPRPSKLDPFPVGCTARNELSGDSPGFSAILATTLSSSRMTALMKKLSSISAECFGPSYTTLNGRSYQNLVAFAPEADWEALDCTSLAHGDGRRGSDGL